ncbi:SusC/RagA family TonB-linked outer membrane protein [Bacteroidia bacterium]|nr:SusC/RagA family TonB-linked outer membrane protein [Bacteroidia bacterium]
MSFIGLQYVFAQQTGTSGVVISEDDGEPIIGAAIIVKGTTIGAVTDVDGKFSFDAPANATLEISYVGLLTKEVKAGQNLRIMLSTDSQSIDEVIVVAYGTSKKSSFTGSATAVGSQQLEKRVLTNVTNVLEGHVAGLQTTSSMGQPGAEPTFRIRGFGSINSKSDPLIVLDGAIFNGSFQDLNANDIESMTVLKDAASTSLYGSSAGNGVILVTTKQGKGEGGAHQVNATISQGFSHRSIPEYDRIDVFGYYPVQWEMLKNVNQYNGKQDPATAAANASKNIYNQLKYNPFRGIPNDQIVGTDGKLNPAATDLLYGDDLDWGKEGYRTGYFQDYNLSYSSKTDKSDSYASFGYQNNKGYALKTGLERFTGRVNYNIYPTKWFKSGLNLSASHIESERNPSDDTGNSGLYTNIFRLTRVMAPIYPVYKHDPVTGQYVDIEGNPLKEGDSKVYDYNGNRMTDPGRHGIAESEWNDRIYNRDQYSANAYMEFSIYNGLKLKLSGNLENRNLKTNTYENKEVGDGSPAGRFAIERNTYTTWQYNQLATYFKQFGKHTIDLLAGHESYGYKRSYMRGMRQGEIVDGLHEFENFVTINSLRSYTNNYTKESYLFRGNYNYDDRYYASVSYRRDGSSRFYKDNRWGNFYSIGASWRLDQENFLKNVSWINSLKLRGSYGETGNDFITDADGYETFFGYQTLYSLGDNNRDEAGVYFDIYGNKDLKWETVVSSDVAVEFGLFGRLTGSIEYFNKHSKDLIFNVPVATSTGAEKIRKNIGRIDNYGVEIDLNYLVFKNKDWRVNVGGNATLYKNKIKSLPEETPKIVDGTKQYEVGHSRYDWWLRQYVGVDPDNGLPLYIFDAENQAVGSDVFEKDGRQLTTNITKAKYAYSGSAIPKVFGGFNASANYKGFELSAVLSYQLGGKILDSNYQSLMENKYGYAMHTDALKAWKNPGEHTNIPRLDQSIAANADGTSSRWLISSDYLNIKNITLSYTLPKSILRPIGFKSTRISLSGENIYQFNARKGLDAMSGYNGLQYNSYVPARSLTASLNFSF